LAPAGEALVAEASDDVLVDVAPAAYQHLGRLVAGAKNIPHEELRARHRQQLMVTLSVIATTRRHVNVLQHMLGFYRKGLLPLVVPLTLIRHHVRRLSVPYLQGQVYLEPHPRELMLLNHV
jgi:uncharacterized protein YbgA (DUF1722 family)